MPEIGILEVLNLVGARKYFVLAAAILGGVATAAFSLVLPRMYTATAVIMPPQQTHSTAAALLGQLGTLAGVGGPDLSLKTPAELYIGILGIGPFPQPLPTASTSSAVTAQSVTATLSRSCWGAPASHRGKTR